MSDEPIAPAAAFYLQKIKRERRSIASLIVAYTLLFAIGLAYMIGRQLATSDLPGVLDETD